MMPPCGWDWCDGSASIDACGECASKRTFTHHTVLLLLALWWLVLVLGCRLWLLLRRAHAINSDRAEAGATLTHASVTLGGGENAP